MKLNPLTQIDFYKADHRRQYPEGTTLVYSNFTPRSNKLSNLPCDNNNVVFFGLQYFIKDYLIECWNDGFFNKSKEEVVKAYKRIMDNSLGPDAIPVDHIEDLYDLGYLPIEIRALEEGTESPIGVPLLTIHNTLPEFFWIVNYLETVMSSYLWKPVVSATTARWYKKKLDQYALQTASQVVLDLGFTMIQGHDFSARGMSGPYDAAVSGGAHMTSFAGTDTVHAIEFLETYYNANVEKELVGGSVPATEHSVMCMGEKEKEIETFRRLIEDLYPSGIVSIVSDTWDFWQVLTEYLPALKDKIMARTGGTFGDKVVIRPDSGDPVKIICGDESAEPGTAEHIGAVELLWGVFGGTVNEKGYKELDSHIGLIYGDSITPQRAIDIMEGLKAKGFASTNVVFGIGSYTYQHVTRDTPGLAMKATYGEVNGKGRNIFKDPKTDSGTKKSHCGLLKVERNPMNGNRLETRQEVSWDEANTGELKPVFKDGKLLRETTLSEIREKLK